MLAGSGRSSSVEESPVMVLTWKITKQMLGDLHVIMKTLFIFKVYTTTVKIEHANRTDDSSTKCSLTGLNC